MRSRRNARAFLGLGSWIPLDIEGQLIHQLEVLRAWAPAHEPLEPSVARVVHIQMADIEHLLDLGTHCDMLVTADRWRATVQELAALTASLTVPR